METLLKILTALLIIFGLAACDKPVSVSAVQSQSGGFKGEFSFSNTDTKSATSGAKSITKTPLLTSLITASEKTHSHIEGAYLLQWADEDAHKFKPGMELSRGYVNQRVKWREGCGLDVVCGVNPEMNLKVLEDNPEALKNYTQSLKLPSSVDEWFSPMDALIEKAIKGDKDAAVNFLVRYHALADFNDGVKPSSGWIRYKQLTDYQGDALLINTRTRLLRFSNLLASELFRIMPKNFKNPSDVRHDFVLALVKLPTDSIIQIYNQAGQEAFEGFKNSKTIQDAVTKSGTAWTTGANSYAGTPDGWTLKTGGQLIFGQGYIGGQLTEIEISSSLEVAKKTEKGNRTSGTSGTDESVKGSTSAK